MNKKIIFGALIFILVVAIGSIVISAQINNSGVGAKVSAYVQDFVGKKGINSTDIKTVGEVDFNDLPKEVNIENVGDNNLAIYEVNYSQGNQDKKLYVVTYSVDKLKSQGDLIVAHDNRQFLDFGYPGVMKTSGFLDTSTGVETSGAKGYVMTRDGSITGVSTNLEIVQANSGKIDIIILKDGTPISFGNTFDSDALGIKKDYDVQSKDIVNFNAGDVISVLVKSDGNVAWRDVITEVEITTLN